ncbi:hypothetical protein [Spirosoma spitsbergense]|uniref:hypothetical protein n=1 Tax=Spirosoma spitsbergense TaxID=431554 RepID=UPI000381ABCE|nr:hypothetical protein [Spirosoma spitsbergense]
MASYALKINNPNDGIAGWPKDTEMMLRYDDLTCQQEESNVLGRFATFEDLLPFVVPVTNLGAQRDCGTTAPPSSANTSSDGEFQGDYSVPN